MAYRINAVDVMVYFEDDPEPVSLIDVLQVLTERIEALEEKLEQVDSSGRSPNTSGGVYGSTSLEEHPDGDKPLWPSDR